MDITGGRGSGFRLRAKFWRTRVALAEAVSRTALDLTLEGAVTAAVVTP